MSNPRYTGDNDKFFDRVPPKPKDEEEDDDREN